jgi:hypothetical protein
MTRQSPKTPTESYPLTVTWLDPLTSSTQQLNYNPISLLFIIQNLKNVYRRIYDWITHLESKQWPEPRVDIVPHCRYSNVVAQRLPTSGQGEEAKQPDSDLNYQSEKPGVLKETLLFTSDEESEQIQAQVVYQPQDEKGLWTMVQR